jgi:Dual specificity protein phosphatase, N-terminal half
VCVSHFQRFLSLILPLSFVFFITFFSIFHCRTSLVPHLWSRFWYSKTFHIQQERLYYAALKCAPPSHNILASTPKRTNLPAGMAAAQAAAAAATASAAGPQDPAGTTTSTPKKDKKQIHFFNMDNELVYWNFFLDFGPLNLGQLIRFSNKLNDKLRKFPVVCFYSNTVPAKRANAIFLICAWQILYLQRTPEQAHAGFLPAGANETTSHIRTNGSNKTLTTAASSSTTSSSSTTTTNGGRLQEGYSWPPVSDSQGAVTIQTLPPWHDASPIACTYDLTVRDCLDGLVQAIRHGFFDLDTFNVEEYEHFEQVEVSSAVFFAKRW